MRLAPLRGLITGLFILSSSGFAAATDKPVYGGALEVGTIYSTLSALSWDHKDWPWKINHDAGSIYEQLLVGDLSKAKRTGGPFPFKADAWVPTDALKGELAESWSLQEEPLAIVFKLRKGIMFPAKPGVMEARELTADDVVFSWYYRHNSPRKTPGFNDEFGKVVAVDRYTVAFHFNQYMADWPYRLGYGYNSSIMPKEVVDAGAGDWKNLTGTGPFSITDYVPGNSHTYTKRADYWDKDIISGTELKLPLLDKVVYRIIKDESTRVTAFRTGKLDILESVNWQNLDVLRKSNPHIKHDTWTNFSGTMLVLRTDTKPFDDIRVRRALNLAVNKEEIVKSYYNGNAELFAYPMHPDFVGYYEPLSAMPDSVKELFTYDPAKAKKLLAEAGFPNGFSFKVQVTSANQEHQDLLPMIAGYLEKVGVKIEIQTMEYAAFLSVMSNKTHAAGYFMNIGHSNPLTAIRKNFVTGQRWNPSMWSDPAFDAKMDATDQERDEDKRKVLIRELTREILDKAPHIWLPTPKLSTVWWPWVKNYSGELRAGAVRPGPVYARIWIDQALKTKMGY
ncbi:MAG: ABC transporter substrate-binding protein [Oxalobacteraceae bacterium]|nr:MAG: ABC transporter substrate-binding protein [Oxalobacteraceae bacterium]